MILTKHLFIKNPDLIKRSLINRGISQEHASIIISNIVNILEQRKKIQGQLQELFITRKHYKKSYSNDERMSAIQLCHLTPIKHYINSLEKQLATLDKELKNQYDLIPNIIEDDTPASPVVVEQWGEKKTTFIATPGIDTTRASNTTAKRFLYLHGTIARVHRALANFMLDQHAANQYQETYCPLFVNRNSLFNTGQLPKFEDDVFQIAQKDQGGNDFFLIPTGEVSLVNLFKNTIIKAEHLPIKIMTLTPCFRAETGGYSSSSKDLIRQRQFDKVELVQIVEAEQSRTALKEMVEQVSMVLKKLEISHQIVRVPGYDIAFSAAHGYDIEGWLPSQDAYVELSSCSHCSDFQSRRMMCRFTRNKIQNYPHTLNGSGLAVGRTLKTFLEQHLSEEGVYIPEALRPYVGNKAILPIDIKYFS